jgi:DnaJ-class molecular chaperone
MNLKQEDLFSECPTCSGKGYYLFEENILVGIVNSGSKRCENCDARGIKLTENGVILKDFIKALQRAKFI